MFTRVVRSEIGGLRGEMNAGIGGLRAEMNARFNAVDARFDAVEIRFNGVDARIDRGVSLTRRPVARAGGAPTLAVGMAQIDPAFQRGRAVKKGRKLRLIATSGRQRSPFSPEVATFAEQGFKPDAELKSRLIATILPSAKLTVKPGRPNPGRL